MIEEVSDLRYKAFAITIILLFAMGVSIQPAVAQSSSQDDKLKKLRSDVGIHGFTANFHWLNDLELLDNSTFQTDGSSELEIVYRNVRMMSQRLGVGFQVLTSLFVNGPESNFGVGSWGIGPVVRAYPFRTNRFQPYVQLNSMMGNNLALAELANTVNGQEGFRVRLGIRGGVSVRLSNTIGLFTEIGYDWESSRIFRADARTLQANIGIDFYLFN